MPKLFLVITTVIILISCAGNDGSVKEVTNNHTTQNSVICDTFPVDKPGIKDYKKSLSIWLETTSLDWFLKNRQNVWRKAKAWGINYVSLDSNTLLKCMREKQKSLFLYIPNHFYTHEINGNEYINFFIVNNTPDTILIPKIDEVISNISSSISNISNADIRDQWVSFQKSDTDAACANSHFYAKLPPGTAIKSQLESEYLNLGDTTVNYRLELTLDKNIKAVSNTIQINLMKTQLPYLANSIE